MENKQRHNNKFISDWLAVLPDLVALCTEDFEVLISPLLGRLKFDADSFATVITEIRNNDFVKNPKLVVKNFKIDEKIYQIDIDKILFQEQNFHYCRFSDITEFESLNLELQHARAQQINIARLTELAELAGGISHEISNPLTIVMAKVSFLQNKLANLDVGVDKEKIHEALAKIIHHSNRITKIIKGLKNFSRSDDRELFVKADLKELLDEAFLLTIENIKMKGILLDTSGFNGQVMVSCHPVQLVQVFVNLLKNACDALEEVRQPIIRIYSEVDDKTVKLFFEDNGPGVPAEIREKIFNPFFTTKPTGKGTGLGLSLSHHIIRQHDGKLTLDSERGPSCFCIQLNVNQFQ